MKRKGFTLIELLAVIVILAVIALISMPLVLNTIDKAKKGAANESVNSYVSAVETAIVSDMVKSNYNYNPEQTFTLGDNGKKIVNGEKELEVNIKGTYPSSGNVVIKNAIVVSAALKVNGYDINYKAELPTDTKYSNGTAIYYNPETNTKCSETEAVSETGVKSGCMKWYTFNDTESSSTVNMILDHNTTALVAWNSTGNNSEMKEVKFALESDTESWDKSINPRLITADEIAKITENTEFDSSKSTEEGTIYLDSNNQNQVANSQVKSRYAWLYDYTSNCALYGCNIEEPKIYDCSETTGLCQVTSTPMIGYWTSDIINIPEVVWVISFSGSLIVQPVVPAGSFGVRPVVTVEKTIIK